MSEEILTYIKNTVDRIEENQNDHAKRITEVEKWQANANGKMTMLGAVGVAIGGFFTAFFQYFRH